MNSLTMRGLGFWFAIVVSCGTLFPGWADPTAESAVEATLVADATAVAEGRPLWLGVHAKLAPGWHVYWEYPGESGFATKITWELGDVGTTSVTTLFPIPVRFVGAGNVVSYGYADEVLFLAQVPRVHIPTEANQVTLRAKVRWLLCREEECRDGRQVLELKLPVGTPHPANTELFERFRRLLPVEERPENVTPRFTSAAGKGELVLEVRPPEGAMGLVARSVSGTRAVEFFPLPPKNAVVSAPTVEGESAPVATAVGKVDAFTTAVTIRMGLVRSDRASSQGALLGGVLVQQTIDKGGNLGPVQASKFAIPIE